MEKENMVAVAATGVEAPVIAVTGLKAPVPAAARVQAPIPAAGDDWDPYEEDPYIATPNPYDTNIVDAYSKEDNNDVCSNDKSFHMKAHHVLRRLQSGSFDTRWAGSVCSCPFCNRSIGNDFNIVMRHAENIGSTCPKVGQTVNVHALAAKHKALGLHLRHLRNLAIEWGEKAPPKPKPPKVLGLGSKKERK